MGRLGGTGPADERRRVRRCGLSNAIEPKQCIGVAIGTLPDVLTQYY